MTEKSKAADQEERVDAKAKGSAADKLDLNKMVEMTTDRIAYLKRQYEDLQKQRADLEELSRQRKELDSGKREAVASLERAIATLEHEENDFQRKHGLVQTTKEEFKKALAELRGIREEEWASENIKDELHSALAVVSRARSDFSKAQGQIQALTAHSPAGGEEPRPVGAGPALPLTELPPRELFTRAMLFFLPGAILALLLILIARLLR